METDKNIKNYNFIEFIKKSKYSIIIITLAVLFAFGQRLISGSFSIDTELYISNIGSNVNWDWWIDLNRWGLVLVNQVLQMDALPIFASNYVTVVLMIVYAITFNYLFYTYISDKYKMAFVKYQFIFPMIFLTNPIFAEQYNFIHQNIGVAIGILMIPITLLLIDKAISNQNITYKVIFFIMSIAFIAFCFGIYQSIPLLYIATVAVCYLLKVLKEGDNNWKFLLQQIGLFALGAILYFVISKLTGESSGYLQSAWLKDSVSQCLINIWNCIKSVLRCEGIFYHYGYVLSIAIMLALIAYLVIKKKCKIGVILALIGILMAPFYIMIITGVDQLKRTQFNYSFVIGIVIMLFVVFLANKSKLKIVKYIMLILAFVIVYRQCYTSANLFYSVDVAYENDKSIAYRIVDRIEEQDWYDDNKDYKLIFIGRHSNKDLKNLYQTSEVIGSSFFEFDYPYIWGVNQRAIGFLKILGYEYIGPSAQEFEDAKKYVEENKMAIWPKNGCITLVDDNKILVRLSEEY